MMFNPKPGSDGNVYKKQKKDARKKAKKKTRKRRMV
jgi:hypothetical protein